MHKTSILKLVCVSLFFFSIPNNDVTSLYTYHNDTREVPLYYYYLLHVYYIVVELLIPLNVVQGMWSECNRHDQFSSSLSPVCHRMFRSRHSPVYPANIGHTLPIYNKQ